MVAPDAPTMINYYKALAAQVGDPTMAAFAQNAKSHTKTHLQEILKVFSRTGIKIGGWNGNKQVLADRVSAVLRWVLEAGRQTTTTKQNDDSSGSSSNDEQEKKMCKQKGQHLVPRGHATEKYQTTLV